MHSRPKFLAGFALAVGLAAVQSAHAANATYVSGEARGFSPRKQPMKVKPWNIGSFFLHLSL